MTTIADLAQLLHETADHHGSFEAVAADHRHDWWCNWYCRVYGRSPGGGSTPDEASAAAGRYMALTSSTSSSHRPERSPRGDEHARCGVGLDHSARDRTRVSTGATTPWEPVTVVVPPVPWERNAMAVHADPSSTSMRTGSERPSAVDRWPILPVRPMSWTQPPRPVSRGVPGGCGGRRTTSPWRCCGCHSRSWPTRSPTDPTTCGGWCRPRCCSTSAPRRSCWSCLPWRLSSATSATSEPARRGVRTRRALAHWAGRRTSRHRRPGQSRRPARRQQRHDRPPRRRRRRPDRRTPPLRRQRRRQCHRADAGWTAPPLRRFHLAVAAVRAPRCLRPLPPSWCAVRDRPTSNRTCGAADRGPARVFPGATPP